MATSDVLEVWKSSGAVLSPYVTPIQNEKQYQAALELFGAIWDDVSDGAESLYDSLFLTLTNNIEAYENEHYAIPDASPSVVLAEVMEQKGVTQQDVERETGISQSTISKLARGERQFTANHIKLLSQYFNLETAAFF